MHCSYIRKNHALWLRSELLSPLLPVSVLRDDVHSVAPNPQLFVFVRTSWISVMESHLRQIAVENLDFEQSHLNAPFNFK